MNREEESEKNMLKIIYLMTSELHTTSSLSFSRSSLRKTHSLQAGAAANGAAIENSRDSLLIEKSASSLSSTLLAMEFRLILIAFVSSLFDDGAAAVVNEVSELVDVVAKSTFASEALP